MESRLMVARVLGTEVKVERKWLWLLEDSIRDPGGDQATVLRLQQEIHRPAPDNTQNLLHTGVLAQS